MSTFINLAADLLLAILLVSAIVSSVALSRRITRLKADESAMRKTVGDLIVASETAERAIAGLRTTLGDCDRTLADRLRTAERYAADLSGQVAAGEMVMNRIAQIVESSRSIAPVESGVRAEPPPPKSGHDEQLSAAALAAQALSERAARRLEGRAA
jgi:hypothetical protein